MASRGRPILIEFASDVRDYLRGTKKVERSTDDIADSLKDAQKDSDKFERKFTSAMKDAERQADRSGRKIEQDFDQVPGKLGEIGEDAGDELVQNLGESIGSGDVEGILQGTLGGVVSGLGQPLGLAAGILGAGATLAFSKWRENAEKQAAEMEEMLSGFEQRFRDLYEQGIQTASNEERLAAFSEWVAENAGGLAELQGLAQEYNLDILDIAAAAFEGGDAWDVQAAKLFEVASTTREINGLNSTQFGEVKKIVDFADELVGKTSGVKKEQTLANAAVDKFAELLGVADDNADGLYNNLDESVAAARDTADNTKTITSELGLSNAEAAELDRRLSAMSTRRYTATVNVQTTGPGARFLPNTNSTPPSPSNGAAFASRYNNSSSNRRR